MQIRCVIIFFKLACYIWRHCIKIECHSFVIIRRVHWSFIVCLQQLSNNIASSSAIHLPTYPPPPSLSLFSAAPNQFSSAAAFPPLYMPPLNGLSGIMFPPYQSLNGTSAQLIDSARLLSSLAPYLPPSVSRLN